MNWWLWIILLLCCGGNCGNSGCGNTRRSNCCNSRSDWNNSGRSDCDCMNYNHTCGCVTEVNDCGCVSEMDACGCEMESNSSYDYMNEANDCGCHDHDMPYETFGCQENGIPCPPPVPTTYMR